ncbi:MAG: cytochrome C [Acidobacteria bacterium]|nr:MAG: cytochrome C [Acidobacteriota bacterium]
MLKKILKIALIVVVVAFIVVQFIRPDFTNPPVNASETLWSSTTVPDDVRQVLVRSCGDCHSNETAYPWYAKITPSNWYLANHIAEGRREMNLSVWNTYTPKKKLKKLEELCEQVERKEMPLPSYLWIHWNAALSDTERTMLCDWSKAESARMPLQ